MFPILRLPKSPTTPNRKKIDLDAAGFAYPRVLETHYSTFDESVHIFHSAFGNVFRRKMELDTECELCWGLIVQPSHLVKCDNAFHLVNSWFRNRHISNHQNVKDLKKSEVQIGN